MALEDDNLDDVISSLIDEDPDGDQQSHEGLPGFPEVSGEVSEHPIQLTERAARQINKIQSDEDLDEELYLRVAVEGGGCSGLSYKLGFDVRTDEDNVYESQGMEVIVNPKHIIYLNGIQIDYPDGLDARGFTFENPNASEACGCGSSFAV
ncbi:iron-sulfur cluster assembly accessory protein [Rhodohalobacter sp. SW132]|uniref:HesB/IscA family protein n=1 Tax=Rhodohalobacter sp. SW132 TaxID=2293433 RepID=UPI000E27530D|nr:iron-sulfur cluster assembly accessory protein [Rhodohalobacter sp. SW132]REL38771.1 iron-sulfur cluster assembly accessory protein [Rhodohalobacter sp. SW132]